MVVTIGDQSNTKDYFLIFMTIIFSTIHAISTMKVKIACIKMSVYQGADCIVYKLECAWKSQHKYAPCPIKIPIKPAVILFKAVLTCFIMPLIA